MKNLLLLLSLTVLLCSGCKYFKKSSAKNVDTITADTMPMDAGIIDSAELYSGISSEPAPSAVAKDPAPASSMRNAVNGRYYMIVGCFTLQENASRYAEKLRGMGYEAQIIAGPSSYQMVAARSYGNYRESVADIDKFRNEVTPNAWVYLQK